MATKGSKGGKKKPAKQDMGYGGSKKKTAAKPKMGGSKKAKPSKMGGKPKPPKPPKY